MPADHRSEKLITRIRALDTGEGVAIGELEEDLEIHRRTLLRSLKDLMKSGDVTRSGKGRGTRYTVVATAARTRSPAPAHRVPEAADPSGTPLSPTWRAEFHARSRKIPTAPPRGEDWICQFIAHSLRLAGRWVTPAQVFKGPLLPLDDRLVENHRRALESVFGGEKTLPALRNALVFRIDGAPQAVDRERTTSPQISADPLEHASAILIAWSASPGILDELFARLASLVPLVQAELPLPTYSAPSTESFAEALRWLRGADDPQPLLRIFANACDASLVKRLVPAHHEEPESTSAAAIDVGAAGTFPSALDPRTLRSLRETGMDFDEYRSLVSLLSKNPELRDRFQRKILGD
jgi:hypothetical protein